MPLFPDPYFKVYAPIPHPIPPSPEGECIKKFNFEFQISPHPL